METLLLVLCQLGLLCLVGATAFATGRLVVRRWLPELAFHPVLLALGIAVLGQAAWLLAACNLLRPSIVLTSVLLVHALAWRDWATAIAALAERLRLAPARSTASLLGAGVLAITPGFILGLYPPTGFDETTYHLPFVRAIAATGELPWLPELRVPTFPVLQEVLAAPLLQAGGEPATHLLGVVATLATAALLAAWGSACFGTGAGPLAAALFLGSPLVTYLAVTGYVEPLLGLLMTAAFYAVWRGGRDGDLRWAALAGLLAGSAAAVKYLGLYAVFAVCTLALLGTPGRRVRAALTAGVTAGLALTPTYARLWVLTGNPVLPFLPGWFGFTPWSYTAPPIPETHSRLVGLARLPFDAVFERPAVGWHPPLSPVFLLSVPLLVALTRSRAARPLLAVLGGYLLLLLAQPPNSRYLMPLLPVWSLLAAAAGCAAWRRFAGSPPRTLAIALAAVALILPGALYAPFWIARWGPVPTSPAARAAYLGERVPQYRALVWLEQQKKTEDYVLYCLQCEQLHGLSRERLLGDWMGPWRFEIVAPLLEDPPALHRQLRAMGVGYLVLPRGSSAGLREPAAARRFALLHVEADAEVWAVR
jgi:hypothetical protein